MLFGLTKQNASRKRRFQWSQASTGSFNSKSPHNFLLFKPLLRNILQLMACEAQAPFGINSDTWGITFILVIVPVSEHLIALSAVGFTLDIDLLANLLGGNPLVLLAAAESKFHWICEQFSSVF